MPPFIYRLTRVFLMCYKDSELILASDLLILAWLKKIVTANSSSVCSALCEAVIPGCHADARLPRLDQIIIYCGLLWGGCGCREREGVGHLVSP